jgi:hypothetical protein
VRGMDTDEPWLYFEWGTFVEEVGRQAWEKKWDIALTLIPGGALMKLVGLATKGRCFWLIVCFTAGTDVWTDEGLKDIEDIPPGSFVWSYNESVREWELCEVLGTSQTDYDGEIATITIADDEGACEHVECTAGHPFWVATGLDLERRPTSTEFSSDEDAPTSTGRWIEARWLRLGDQFLTRTGRSATVVGLSIRFERIKVYNLAVNRLHNYTVGHGGMLVHNECPGQSAIRGIYIFENARTGALYVGRSVDVVRRLAQHGDKVGRVVNIIPEAGNLAVAEQRMINALGGIANLENKINAVARWRWPGLGILP